MAFDFVHPSKLGIVHVHSEAEEGRRQSDPIKIDSFSKSPNFIRTKARHFDNLMSWLVRLGSIK